ncbi:hypothetical protein R1sor_023684 [Riccia sorocarpa]|uniref:SCN5A-like C-terminal IQ motif domain-containing protein n=1 Tax=Riccia sorocarpa TaxID=122646 RepID=A0ABD3GNG9_9MARC
MYQRDAHTICSKEQAGKQSPDEIDSSDFGLRIIRGCGKMGKASTWLSVLKAKFHLHGNVEAKRASQAQNGLDSARADDAAKSQTSAASNTSRDLPSGSGSSKSKKSDSKGITTVSNQGVSDGTASRKPVIKPVDFYGPPAGGIITTANASANGIVKKPSSNMSSATMGGALSAPKNRSSAIAHMGVIVRNNGGAAGIRRMMEEWAATVIQTAFRKYLARQALKALKGLVRLQALVRGHLVRRRIEALVRINQERASHRRSRTTDSYSPQQQQQQQWQTSRGPPSPAPPLDLEVIIPELRSNFNSGLGSIKTRRERRNSAGEADFNQVPAWNLNTDSKSVAELQAMLKLKQLATMEVEDHSPPAPKKDKSRPKTGRVSRPPTPRRDRSTSISIPRPIAEDFAMPGTPGRYGKSVGKFAESQEISASSLELPSNKKGKPARDLTAYAEEVEVEDVLSKDVASTRGRDLAFALLKALQEEREAKEKQRQNQLY